MCFLVFASVLYVGWKVDFYAQETRRIEKEHADDIKNIKVDLEWQELEEQLNKRQDIIGQNGNTGLHYDLDRRKYSNGPSDNEIIDELLGPYGKKDEDKEG